MAEKETKTEAKPKVVAEPTLADVLAAVQGIGDRVTKLEKGETATDQVAKVIADSPEAKGQHPDDGAQQEFKIHPRHRQIVTEVLGEQFIAYELYEGVPSTHFLFNIEVPKELSSVPESEWKRGVRDIRSKAITNAEGENGVRDWCQAVRNNLTRFYQGQGIAPPFKN